MKMIHSFLFAIAFAQSCGAFVAPSKSFTFNTPATIVSSTSTDLQMMVPDASMATSVVDSMSSLTISEVEAWVQPLSIVLGPFLNLFSFAMLCRVVISWYPTANLNEFPYNLAVWPTEPLLRLVRGSVPPAFGVDITPIVWLAIFTFFNEILVGQQGLLTMKMKYGI